MANHKGIEFGIHNIAGMKDQPIEKIVQLEQEAEKRFLKMEVKNDDDLDFAHWCKEVMFRCDEEMKRRGERSRKEWELLFA